MEIRPAREEDVIAVLPLVEKIAALHASWDAARFDALPGVSGMYEGWLRHRASDEQSVFLVADREDAIVAFLIATTDRNIPIYRVAEFGFIHDLWVDEAYRNEGIARSMTMLALEKFKAMGLTQVRLDTAAKNDRARAMFAQCGFRESAREMLCEL